MSVGMALLLLDLAAGLDQHARASDRDERGVREPRVPVGVAARQTPAFPVRADNEHELLLLKVGEQPRFACDEEVAAAPAPVTEGNGGDAIGGVDPRPAGAIPTKPARLLDVR